MEECIRVVPPRISLTSIVICECYPLLCQMLQHSDSPLYYYCYYSGRMVDQTGLLAQKTEKYCLWKNGGIQSRLWHLSFLWLHLDSQSSIEHEELIVHSVQLDSDSMLIGWLKVMLNLSTLPMYVCSSVMTWQLCSPEQATGGVSLCRCKEQSVYPIINFHKVTKVHQIPETKAVALSIFNYL